MRTTMIPWCSSALTLALAVAACYSIPSDHGETAVCEPGEVRACEGPPNCPALQVCDAEGAGFGECLCPADDPPATQSTGETGVMTTTSGTDGPGESSGSAGSPTSTIAETTTSSTGDASSSSTGAPLPCDGACDPNTETCADDHCVALCQARIYTLTNVGDVLPDACGGTDFFPKLYICDQGTNDCSDPIGIGDSISRHVPIGESESITLRCCLVPAGNCPGLDELCHLVNEADAPCICAKANLDLTGDSCEPVAIDACGDL